jgi:hypothetical protein
MRTTTRNKANLAIACGAILLIAGNCTAQDENAKSTAEPQKYFHLDFVVKQLEGEKVIGARHYSATTAVGQKGEIRAGNKVPIQTGSAAGLTFVDVGVNIDCTAAKEIEGSLPLSVFAEISSVAVSSNPPLIRQTKWSSNVIVPIGKPTVIFSSDDLATKGQTQLELTATPVGVGAGGVPR